MFSGLGGLSSIQVANKVPSSLEVWLTYARMSHMQSHPTAKHIRAWMASSAPRTAQGTVGSVLWTTWGWRGEFPVVDSSCCSGAGSQGRATGERNDIIPSFDTI